VGNVDKLPLVTDPTTGQQRRMMLNHNGELYDPFAKSGSGANSPEQFKERMTAALRDDWFKSYKDAMKYADDRIKQEIEAERDPLAKDQKGTSAWEDPKNRAGARQIYMREFMEGAGYAPTWEATLAKMQSQGAAPGPGPQPAGPAGDMGRRPGMMGVSNADKPVAGMEGPVREPAKPAPFKFDDPSTQKTEAQKAAAESTKELWAAVGKMGLPKELESKAAEHYTAVQKALEEFGSTEAMPPAVYEWYKANRGEFLKILRTAAAPKPQGPPDPFGAARLKYK
jgi:hypothetical protein